MILKRHLVAYVTGGALVEDMELLRARWKRLMQTVGYMGELITAEDTADQRAQVCDRPPSIETVSPVIQPARSDERKAISSATSSG